MFLLCSHCRPAPNGSAREGSKTVFIGRAADRAAAVSAGCAGVSPGAQVLERSGLQAEAW
jgi:hypothetical protein